MKFRIEDLLESATLLDYARTKVRKPYFGENLFPERKIQGLTLKYIKGANNLPVAANVHAFGTEAEVGERDAINLVQQKLALVKRKIQMDEELLIQLQSKNDSDLKEAIKEIYDDVDRMVEGVRARAEFMRMEALTTGKLSTHEQNRMKIEINYGVPVNHQEVLTTTWDQEGAAILEDIKRWSDTILVDTGIKPTRALTSSKVLNTMLMNPKVRRSALGVNSDMVMTRAQLNQLLESMELPTVVTYDGMAQVDKLDKSGYETKRFFDEDKFVMFPDGKLGDTVYGLTAEEIELRASDGLEKEKFGNIVAVIYRTIDPPSRWTKAAATVLPSFPRANEVFIAKVR